MNANVNNVDCLVRKAQLGHDTVYNICTGTQQSIPWGIVDYIEFSLLFLICLALLLLVHAILLIAIDELRGY